MAGGTQPGRDGIVVTDIARFVGLVARQTIGRVHRTSMGSMTFQATWRSAMFLMTGGAMFLAVLAGEFFQL